MSSDIIIRHATALDAVNIARLMRASWEKDQAVPVAQVNDLRTLQYIAELIDDAFVVVADLSGRLIGVLACSLMRERWSRPEDWFLIDEFFVVSSNWIDRGIPDRLIAEAEVLADRKQIPFLMGGSLLSVPLDPILGQRPGYSRSFDARYLRMPQVSNNEIEQPAVANVG